MIINQKRILILIFLVSLGYYGFSQPAWSTGVDGDVNVTGTLKTDNVKINPSPGTYAVGTNTIVIPSNPGFAVGDRLVIIQMLSSGALTGKLNETNITAISGAGPFTLTLYSQMESSYVQNAGTGDVIQILKVYNYHNVTVQSGGLITCDAWNGSLGGVVYFMVSGTLEVKTGGSIDVSGLGYRAGTAGTGGTGGTGGTAGTAGGVNANGGAGGNSGVGGAGGVGAGDGAAGGDNGNAATSGTAGTNGEGISGGTIAVAAKNNSVYASVMQLGGGGAGGNGGNGGTGGGGGGGGGGASLINAGVAGVAGGSGGNGGNGGAGGKGGGIIRITADTLIYTGNILARGENGAAGTSGTAGAAGGAGGAGGSTLGIGGLGGGGGGGGNGADGGCNGMGGGGGGGGVIWIDYNELGTATGTVSSSAGSRGANGAVGAAGAGGAAGAAGTGLLANGNPGTAGSAGAAGCSLANNMNGTGGTAVVNHFVIVPITLINFDAKLIADNMVQIDWSTATQINTNYFDIERSADGLTFSTIISQVPAAGNSNVILNYQKFDSKPLLNTSYYRLKAVDLNGDFQYSNVVAVNNEDLVLTSVYPNPAFGNEVNLEFHSKSEADLNLKLVDMLGRLVSEFHIKVNTGKTIVKLDLGDLPSASYSMLFAFSAGEFYTQRLLEVKSER